MDPELMKNIIFPLFEKNGKLDLAPEVIDKLISKLINLDLRFFV